MPIPRQRRQQIADHPPPACLDLRRHRHAWRQLAASLFRLDPGLLQAHERNIVRLLRRVRVTVRRTIVSLRQFTQLANLGGRPQPAPSPNLALLNTCAAPSHHPLRLIRRRSPLHRSEQVLTLSQSRAHFFRQAKGRPQAAQIFFGRLDLSVRLDVIDETGWSRHCRRCAFVLRARNCRRCGPSAPFGDCRRSCRGSGQ